MKNKNKTSEKIYKFFLLIALPSLLSFVIYLALSPSACFNPTQFSHTDVEKYLSFNIEKQYERIQALPPLIELGANFFRYNVFIENKFKLAVVVNSINYYSESTTSLVINTVFGTSTIPFNSKKLIAKSIKIETLPNLINSAFLIGLPNTPELPPNSMVELQSNTKWQLCVFVYPNTIYNLIVFLVLLFFEIELLSLIKEAKSFLDEDFHDYFNPPRG